MKLFLLVVIVCAVVYDASAYRLWGWLSDDDNSDDLIEAMEDVTEECRRFAALGQCEFYDCLEDRFPCGEDGYTQKISKHFCAKINSNYAMYDNFGKRWLNQTSICLQSLQLPVYLAESASCAQIKEAGIQAILTCNAGQVDGKTFCDFLDTNGNAYNSLMGREEIMLMASLKNPSVFRSMVSQAMQCGVRGMGDTLRSLGSSISDFAGSMITSIRSWFH